MSAAHQHARLAADHALSASMHAGLAVASVPVHLTTGIVGGALVSPVQAYRSRKNGDREAAAYQQLGIAGRPAVGTTAALFGTVAGIGGTVQHAAQAAGHAVMVPIDGYRTSGEPVSTSKQRTRDTEKALRQNVNARQATLDAHKAALDYTTGRVHFIDTNKV